MIYYFSPKWLEILQIFTSCTFADTVSEVPVIMPIWLKITLNIITGLCNRSTDEFCKVQYLLRTFLKMFTHYSIAILTVCPGFQRSICFLPYFITFFYLDYGFSADPGYFMYTHVCMSFRNHTM